MFAPVAVDNIAFPERTSLSTLDFIPESFEAWNAYSNIPTASTYTTQSIVTSFNSGGAGGRWGMGPNGKIFGVYEAATTGFVWNISSNSMDTGISLDSPGTTRNVLYDNLTNSWVLCGNGKFVKINCDTYLSSSITLPNNGSTFTQSYPATVVFGGKAYGLPLTNTSATTGVLIVDLVANTATTSSVKAGNGTYWGGILNSIGTIYFFQENGGTNVSIFEYNPTTTSGSSFGTLAGTPGYNCTNLPDGTVLVSSLGATGNNYIINPVNKAIATLAKSNFTTATGLCVGQDGNAYAISSTAGTGLNGIFRWNPRTQTGMDTGFVVQRPSGGGRGFNDMFSLSDGRLVAMPGGNNNGLLVYYSYLANPSNNTFPQIAVANQIMANGKGL